MMRLKCELKLSPFLFFVNLFSFFFSFHEIFFIQISGSRKLMWCDNKFSSLYQQNGFAALPED